MPGGEDSGGRRRAVESDSKLYLTRFEGISESEVRAEFEMYGEVIRMTLQYNEGFGFVEYKDARDAEDALLGIIGKTFGTNSIMIEFSRDCRRCQEPVPHDWVPAWRRYGMLGPKPEWMLAKEREADLETPPPQVQRRERSPSRMSRRERSRSPGHPRDYFGSRPPSPKRFRAVLPQGNGPISAPDPDARSLFIRNVTYSLPEEEIDRFLSSYGEVVSVYHPTFKDGQHQGRRRGICFVEYRTHEMAEAALANMNGQTLDSRPLSVTWRLRGSEVGDPARREPKDGGGGYGPERGAYGANRRGHVSERGGYTGDRSSYGGGYGGDHGGERGGDKGGERGGYGGDRRGFAGDRGGHGGNRGSYGGGRGSSERGGYGGGHGGSDRGGHGGSDRGGYGDGDRGGHGGSDRGGYGGGGHGGSDRGGHGGSDRGGHGGGDRGGSDRGGYGGGDRGGYGSGDRGGYGGYRGDRGGYRGRGGYGGSRPQPDAYNRTDDRGNERRDDSRGDRARPHGVSNHTTGDLDTRRDGESDHPPSGGGWDEETDSPRPEAKISSGGDGDGSGGRDKPTGVPVIEPAPGGGGGWDEPASSVGPESGSEARKPEAKEAGE